METQILKLTGRLMVFTIITLMNFSNGLSQNYDINFTISDGAQNH